MFLLPDPAELREIAARIAGHALAARAGANRLRQALAATHWTGFAADALDLQATDIINGLLGSAGRLDDAADALRVHADNVAQVIAGLLHMEHDLCDFGSALSSGLADEVLHPTRLLGDTTNLLGSAGRAAGDLGDLLGIG